MSDLMVAPLWVVTARVALSTVEVRTDSKKELKRDRKSWMTGIARSLMMPTIPCIKTNTDARNRTTVKTLSSPRIDIEQWTLALRRRFNRSDREHTKRQTRNRLLTQMSFLRLASPLQAAIRMLQLR